MGIRTDLAIESTKIEGGIPQKGVEIDQYRGGELSFTAVEVNPGGSPGHRQAGGPVYHSRAFLPQRPG